MTDAYIIPSNIRPCESKTAIHCENLESAQARGVAKVVYVAGDIQHLSTSKYFKRYEVALKAICNALTNHVPLYNICFAYLYQL